MKQSEKKKSLSLFGEAGFDSFYSARFGERWKPLKESLLLPSSPSEFCSGGKKSYFLDKASVLCASALPLENAAEILDMCAAPGGKSIVLASRMSENARLFSNERSSERKRRLSASLEDCLKSDVRERVSVCGKDGAKLCLEKQNLCRFDAILLDAPCSSERHVLCDKKYLCEWSPSRIRSLCNLQWSLISSAWRMLKKGGFLLYSTCALAYEENDSQISRLLKKFSQEAELLQDFPFFDVSAFFKDSLPPFEKSDFGHIVLPDFALGAGPLYFSLVRKIN